MRPRSRVPSPSCTGAAADLAKTITGGNCASVTVNNFLADGADRLSDIDEHGVERLGAPDDSPRLWVGSSPVVGRRHPRPATSMTEGRQ